MCAAVTESPVATTTVGRDWPRFGGHSLSLSASASFLAVSSFTEPGAGAAQVGDGLSEGLVEGTGPGSDGTVEGTVEGSAEGVGLLGDADGVSEGAGVVSLGSGEGSLD